MDENEEFNLMEDDDDDYLPRSFMPGEYASGKCRFLGLEDIQLAPKNGSKGKGSNQPNTTEFP